MDLVAARERTIVATSDTDKYGNPKILDQCKLPFTGKSVVDMIITELAVFHVKRHNHDRGLTLMEYAVVVSIDTITAKAGAHLI